MFFSTFRQNIFLACVCFAVAVFLFPSTVRAQDEVIQDINVHINIAQNGELLVVEQIVYDFGTQQKHGIFRDIPLTNTEGPELSIIVNGVRDEAGHIYQYTTSYQGTMLYIKIGDPERLVTGVHTYIIEYAVQNAIRSFDDHIELYWNVTGNQWPVAIQHTKATVQIVPYIPFGIPRMACFTGTEGMMESACTMRYDEVSHGAEYESTVSFSSGEGMTIVFGIPRGIITPVPVVSQRLAGDANDSWVKTVVIGIFLCVSIAFFFIRIVFGKVLSTVFSSSYAGSKNRAKPNVPKTLRGTPVVVEYAPPDNLPPIDIGTLLDRRTDVADISSVIIDLAVRGYIKIKYTTKEIPFWPDKKDFELVKMKDGATLMHPAEKILFRMLFKERDAVLLSELKDKEVVFQQCVREIKSNTENYLCTAGYLVQKPKARHTITIGPLVIFAVAILSFFLGKAAEFIPLGVILYALFLYKSVPDRITEKGIVVFAKILGFMEFLRLTEKEKLTLLNAPDLQPETFEKFLPYAMVLGVEEQWAEKFEGIYNTTPQWYDDPTTTHFGSHIMTRNLALFGSSFNQVFYITTPRSSSGFSGGHSGGGSGGGGGGSW
jgi:uncharacterized membrane protein YgcG